MSGSHSILQDLLGLDNPIRYPDLFLAPAFQQRPATLPPAAAIITAPAQKSLPEEEQRDSDGDDDDESPPASPTSKKSRKPPKLQATRSFILDKTTRFSMGLNGAIPECILSNSTCYLKLSAGDILQFLNHSPKYKKCTALNESRISTQSDKSFMWKSLVSNTEIPLSRSGMRKMKDKARVIQGHLNALIQSEAVIQEMFDVVIKKYQQMLACNPKEKFIELCRLVEGYTLIKVFIKEFRQAIKVKQLICHFNPTVLCTVVLAQKEYIQTKIKN